MRTLNSFLVKGERCSGTNYLEKLIEENFHISLYDSPDWKHGYFNFGVTDNFVKPRIDYLTIFIFRNVFDWIRSFYLNPHHLEGTKSGCWENKPTFGKFIRQEINIVDSLNNKRNLDKHPYTLENPKNILELRKWKTENWLNYKKLHKPAFYVKYEDLLSNPKKILDEINDQWFNIKYDFKNWTYYKRNTQKTYKPQQYFNIEKDDMNYIVNNVDWDLENKIGYYI